MPVYLLSRHEFRKKCAKTFFGDVVDVVVAVIVVVVVDVVFVVVSDTPFKKFLSAFSSLSKRTF